MTRFIIPLLLVAAAIGLFVLYTDRAYQGVKVLENKLTAYEDALNKSEQLRAERNQLLSKRKTFSTDDVAKLEKVLPDNVDNIRLIIDINNIAARHGLSLQNVALGSVSGSAKSQNALSVGSSGSPVGSVEIGFAVTAPYDSFIAFLQDLEHSERIIDVDRITFIAAETGANTYSLTIRTYWLH